MKTRKEVMAARKAAAAAQKKIAGELQQKLSIAPEYEDGANAEQLEVIRHETGPCRVLAAAGSGKTFALTRRIVRLVERNIVDPERICATTFSKKAGDEMNKRLKKLGVGKARVGTWHSLCLQILREGGTQWSDWEIDGGDDRPQKAKYILKDVLGYKQMNWVGADITKIASFIGRCKANLFAPKSPEARKVAEGSFAWAAPRALEAFKRYNDALAEKMLLTFDDFLVFACEHLSTDENARKNWAGKWDQGLCDEVQDNNRAQQVLTKLLFGDHQNYMAVGDVFQAIYGFRGSTPLFLANFENEWPGAKTIWLPRNYRSGKKIISAANGIVRSAKVPGIEPKDMIGERDLEGEVRILRAEALDDEANEIVGAISKSVDSGDSTYADHTVLYRMNAQSRAVEEALLKKRIPYIVVGGVSFYERREVRDLLAYLRLAASVHSTVDDVKRSINTPFRFLGARFIERVMDEVRHKWHGDAEIDWPGVVEDVAQQERIQHRQKVSAAEWADMLRSMQKAIWEAEEDHATEEQALAGKPSVILDEIIRRTRYIEHLQKEEGDESVENSAPANVRELVRVAERFPSAEEFLNYIDTTIKAAKKQREDKQAGGERVLLMSIHRSKGLEWPYVYVVGMNELIIPHVKGDPEEERRLAYVAATRARDVLTMSYVSRIATRAGIRDAEPSRFLVDTGIDFLPREEPEVFESAAMPPLEPLPPTSEDIPESV